MEALALAIGLDPILIRGQQLIDQFRTWRGNNRQAPELFDSFTSFETELRDCLTRVQAEAAKLPLHSSIIIAGDVVTLTYYLRSARDSLQRLNRRWNSNCLLQFVRANAVNKDCDILCVKLQEARKLLRDADKHVDVVQRINERQSQASIDRFQEFFPPLSSGMRAVLDFDSKDEDGNPMTPEGQVKQQLLEETSGSPSVVSILGIGGVGKSTIAQALSADLQIRERFSDGVHVVKLGKDASTATLSRQICQILKESGAEKTYQTLRSENDMDAALRFFESWFDFKKCAFVIDDVWVHGIGLDLLSRLCKIASRTNDNSVLITTREHEVASLSPRERIVRLEPRDARGPDARQILFFHADHTETDSQNPEVDNAISTILDICAGLPVSLAAAGKNVKIMSIDMPNGEEVWKQYLSQLMMSRARLLRENVQSYGNLFATLATAISFLDANHPEETLGFASFLSFAQMHWRLCVLPKQEGVPNTMLKHLWKTRSDQCANVIARTFVESGLASHEAVTVGEEVVWYLTLHDSLRDFAEAEATRNIGIRDAHEELLIGYSSSGTYMSEDMEETSIWSSKRLKNDGYIHRNLCRHLLGAGRAGELIELLMSPQWAERQLEVNDITFLESDFLLGIAAVQDGMVKHATNEEHLEMEKALRLISEAVTLSSTFISSNIAELRFQLHGRMKRYGDTFRAIREYVSWIETRKETPFLLCSSSFLGEPGGANTKIISVGVPVFCMTLMKDKERVACGFPDGRIVIVNVSRTECEKQWNAHNKGVISIVLGRDGTKLVSGSWDGTAKVWELPTGRCISIFEGHTEAVSCVAVTGDGKRVVSGSSHGSVMVWDMETGQVVSSPSTGHVGWVSSVAVSEDGETVVTGGEDQELRLWNAASGAGIGKMLDGHDDWVNCVTWTSDGQRIISGSLDKKVRVWDVGSHQQIGRSLEGHKGMVECVAVSEDGQRIASGSWDNTIRVWDLESGLEICYPLVGHGDWVTGVSFQADGDRIVSCSGDGTIRVWDVRRNNAERARLETNRHERAVTSVSFSPDGNFVVSGSWDTTLRVWDTTSGQQVGPPMRGHSNWVHDVAVTPDGQYVASVSWDKTLRIWNLETREISHTLHGHNGYIRCVAVTPHGDHLVTGSDDETIRVWNLSLMDGSHEVLQGHNAIVGRVFISEDGLRIISVDWFNKIFVWDLRTKKLVKRFTLEGALKLSRRETLSLVDEVTMHDEIRLSIPLYGRKVLYGEGAETQVLATMEVDVWSWALSPDQRTICAGLQNGQVAFMKLKI